MASKSTKGEILAKFFDDGEYTALCPCYHIKYFLFTNEVLEMT